VPQSPSVAETSATPCCALATSEVTDAEAARIAPMFKALGDPVRLRLASLIASQPEVCVCDLTGEFALGAPTISHHLRVLREAGLVESERRGTWVYYSIRHEALAQLAVLLSVTPAPR
jgi:ArsR family transcriptional regulator, arsenate/arsenite/antimonite-responsive transcriptional repressor